MFQYFQTTFQTIKMCYVLISNILLDKKINVSERNQSKIINIY